MRRRELLTTLLGSLTLAGCTGTTVTQQADPTPSPTPSPSPEPTPTPSPTASPTPRPAPPEFSLVEVTAPDRVAIGESFRYMFTVENTGERAGTFETTISTRVGGSNSRWNEGTEEWRQRIAPGGQAQLRSQEVSFDYMTRIDVRIDALDHVFSVQFVNRTLDWGESYTNPDGVSMAATGVEFEGEYEYSIDPFQYTEEPASGQQWAFVDFWAENDSGQPQWLPVKNDLALLVGNQQFDYELYRGDESDVYEGGEVQPGVRRDGFVLFQAPASASMSDVRIAYSEEFYEGPVAAYWSA